MIFLMTERMIRFNGYVTGYFNIDFIDDSNEADFISTDRKNILWEADEDTAKIKTIS